MELEKIPVFNLVGEYDEEEDIAYFNCPYSGINTFGDDWSIDSYPNELLYYIMPMYSESEYVKPEFEAFLKEFNEGTEENDPKYIKYEGFYEYLATKLSNEKEYYLLFVEHPEDDDGSYIIYFYEGTFKES
jgi:hypothetical protein